MHRWLLRCGACAWGFATGLLAACSLLVDRSEEVVRYVGYNADIVVEVVLANGVVVGGGFAYLRQPGCVWRWHGLQTQGDGRLLFHCMVGVPSKALPMVFEIMLGARDASRLKCRIVRSDSGEDWFAGAVFAWDWAMPDDYDPVEEGGPVR